MSEHQSALEQHLEHGLSGTPTLKAAEQHHYLGTFRERVWLTISVAQLTDDWASVFERVITASAERVVFFNGNLPDEVLRPYLRLAAQHQINFTIKTGPEFTTTAASLAIVIAAKTAINEPVVDIVQRFTPTPATPAPASQPWWQRLFHFGKEG